MYGRLFLQELGSENDRTYNVPFSKSIWNRVFSEMIFPLNECLQYYWVHHLFLCNKKSRMERFTWSMEQVECVVRSLLIILSKVAGRIGIDLQDWACQMQIPFQLSEHFLWRRANVWSETDDSNIHMWPASNKNPVLNFNRFPVKSTSLDKMKGRTAYGCAASFLKNQSRSICN